MFSSPQRNALRRIRLEELLAKLEQIEQQAALTVKSIREDLL